MLIGIVLSLGLTAAMLVFSLIFRVAGKLRLGLPLLYILAAVVSTFFTDWTSENERWVLLGLYILIGLCVLSWVISLVKKIRRRQADRFAEDDAVWQMQRAREMGITTFRFDENGNLLDPGTGKPVSWK